MAPVLARLQRTGGADVGSLERRSGGADVAQQPAPQPVEQLDRHAAGARATGLVRVERAQDARGGAIDARRRAVGRARPDEAPGVVVRELEPRRGIGEGLAERRDVEVVARERKRLGRHEAASVVAPQPRDDADVAVPVARPGLLGDEPAEPVEERRAAAARRVGRDEARRSGPETARGVLEAAQRGRLRRPRPPGAQQPAETVVARAQPVAVRCDGLRDEPGARVGRRARDEAERIGRRRREQRVGVVRRARRRAVGRAGERHVTAAVVVERARGPAGAPGSGPRDAGRRRAQASGPAIRERPLEERGGGCVFARDDVKRLRDEVAPGKSAGAVGDVVEEDGRRGAGRRERSRDAPARDVAVRVVAVLDRAPQVLDRRAVVVRHVAFAQHLHGAGGRPLVPGAAEGEAPRAARVVGVIGMHRTAARRLEVRHSPQAPGPAPVLVVLTHADRPGGIRLLDEREPAQLAIDRVEHAAPVRERGAQGRLVEHRVLALALDDHPVREWEPRVGHAGGGVVAQHRLAADAVAHPDEQVRLRAAALRGGRVRVHEPVVRPPTCREALDEVDEAVAVDVEEVEVVDEDGQASERAVVGARVEVRAQPVRRRRPADRLRERRSRVHEHEQVEAAAGVRHRRIVLVVVEAPGRRRAEARDAGELRFEPARAAHEVRPTVARDVEEIPDGRAVGRAKADEVRQPDVVPDAAVDGPVGGFGREPPAVVEVDQPRRCPSPQHAVLGIVGVGDDEIRQRIGVDVEQRVHRASAGDLRKRRERRRERSRRRRERRAGVAVHVPEPDSACRVVGRGVDEVEPSVRVHVDEIDDDLRSAAGGSAEEPDGRAPGGGRARESGSAAAPDAPGPGVRAARRGIAVDEVREAVAVEVEEVLQQVPGGVALADLRRCAGGRRPVPVAGEVERAATPEVDARRSRVRVDAVRQPVGVDVRAVGRDLRASETKMAGAADLVRRLSVDFVSVGGPSLVQCRSVDEDRARQLHVVACAFAEGGEGDAREPEVRRDGVFLVAEVVASRRQVVRARLDRGEAHVEDFRMAVLPEAARRRDARERLPRERDFGEVREAGARVRAVADPFGHAARGPGGAAAAPVEVDAVAGRVLDALEQPRERLAARGAAPGPRGSRRAEPERDAELVDDDPRVRRGVESDARVRRFDPCAIARRRPGNGLEVRHRAGGFEHERVAVVVAWNAVARGSVDAREREAPADPVGTRLGVARVRQRQHRREAEPAGRHLDRDGGLRDAGEQVGFRRRGEAGERARAVAGLRAERVARRRMRRRPEPEQPRDAGKGSGRASHRAFSVGCFAGAGRPDRGRAAVRRHSSPASAVRPRRSRSSIAASRVRWRSSSTRRSTSGIHAPRSGVEAAAIAGANADKARTPSVFRPSLWKNHPVVPMRIVHLLAPLPDRRRREPCGGQDVHLNDEDVMRFPRPRGDRGTFLRKPSVSRPHRAGFDCGASDPDARFVAERDGSPLRGRPGNLRPRSRKSAS